VRTVTDTEAIRDAVASELRLAALRSRRDELRERVARAVAASEAERRERERVPHCAGCGLRHSGRFTSGIGPLCSDCREDAGAGPGTRHRDELRDVLAWRAVSGDRRTNHVTYSPGLAERVGFRFFCEADKQSLRAETTRPVGSSARFGWLPLELMRVSHAAASLPPDRAIAATVTDIAEWHAARRAEARAEAGAPLHVRPWPSGVVATRAPNDPTGPLQSTLQDETTWGRSRARAIFDRAKRQ
jgi:hypothetical protein